MIWRCCEEKLSFLALQVYVSFRGLTTLHVLLSRNSKYNIIQRKKEKIWSNGSGICCFSKKKKQKDVYDILMEKEKMRERKKLNGNGVYCALKRKNRQIYHIDILRKKKKK